MDAFEELIAKTREVYRLYNAESALRTAVAPGGHQDIEAIRLPVYSFFLKEFLGRNDEVKAEGPVDIPPDEELTCFRDGLPLDERLTRIDEELVQPRHVSRAELLKALREEVFRYFPSQHQPLAAEWSAPVTAQGRTARNVTFTSFEGLRVKAIYSIPEKAQGKLPGLIVVDDRRGIRVWGNEQPLERNQWGNRAVLIVETVDTGTRALENNLRSYVDDDPVHHMKRQAMVAGTTLESMQVYEILRSLELLRGQPEVDAGRISITGKYESAINGMYAALVDGKVASVVLGSPSASHRKGPHYLGILRYADIPDVIGMLAPNVRIYGDAAASPGVKCASLAACLSLAP
jgi:hypothetical protein